MQEALTADEASKTTLKELRKQSGKTAAEVATALGVTRTAITNYESGTRTIDIRYIIPLAKLYDISERELIEAQLNSQLGREGNLLIPQNNHKVVKLKQ